MILWSSREKAEDKPALPHIGRRAWRFVLETGVIVNAWSIGLTEQVWFMDKVGNYTWEPATRYMDVALTRKFKWGSQHAYYDGPHCAFFLGFIHFHWAWNWCKKCMPDD
jgi:hypothetical protein